MKMYKTRFGNHIEEIEVIRQTDKSVVYSNGRTEVREAKISEFNSWHETKLDAVQFLIDVKRREISRLEGKIEYLKNQIISIEKL